MTTNSDHRSGRPPAGVAARRSVRPLALALAMAWVAMLAGAPTARSEDAPEAIQALERMRDELMDAKQGIDLNRALQARLEAHRQSNRALRNELDTAEAGAQQLERECDGNAACRAHRAGLGVMIEHLNVLGIPVGKIAPVPLDYTRRRVQLNQDIARAKDAYVKAMTGGIALDRELDELGINSLAQLEASLQKSVGERSRCNAVLGRIYSYCDTSPALNELRVKCGQLPQLDYLQSNEQRAFAKNVCSRIGGLCMVKCD